MDDITKQFPKSEKGKLNIYFHISENSGVGFYRQYMPAVALRENGIANVMISDFRWGEGNHLEPEVPLLFDLANWADVIVAGRRDIPQFYAQWGGIRDFFNIPIVLDTDDNVRFVRPQNPGYAGYYPGAESITWNKYSISKVFDAITVSTDNLKEFHKKENPKIYVTPNNIVMKEWDALLKKNHNDGFTRIGFIASAAHAEGVNIIKAPLLKIMQEYPKVKFLLTHIYRHMFNDWPQDIQNRIEAIPWIKLQDWPKGSKELGIDIGLAPLADNMFNRAKSNLRWMEYGAAKTAPIVSPVEAYKCVVNGKTGLVAKEKEEWYNAIKSLLDNKQLLYNVSEGAYNEVKTQYDIDKNIGHWEKTYRSIHDKFHEFFGPKKNYLKLNKKGKYQLIKTPY
jgi:glycosyltransferase involved in cell wall biosynthesis